jgi:hypothetical protein
MTVDLRNLPPVDEPVEPPRTLSQTKLARHDKCPRAAYLDLKHGGGPGSIEMDRGTAFHLVPERAVEVMLEQEPPEQTMPGEVATELADAIMAERLDLVLPAAEQDAVRRMAWNWAESFALDPEAHVGCEVPMEIEIGGYRVTCRIDYVMVAGSSLYLEDFKTSLNIRKQEEVEEGFQGKLYALAALFGVHRETGLPLGAGINDVWFYETYPRYRGDDGTLIRREVSWTRQEVYEFKVSVERNVAAFRHSLETGEWPARDGSWCSQCPAPAECPLPAHLREVDPITTVAEAEAAFSRKLALERDNRRLQASLRGWTQENGPIFVGDYAFDAKLIQQKSVKDWNEMLLALHRTSELGMPFEYTDHVEIRQLTKFAKRKITKEERSDAL